MRFRLPFVCTLVLCLAAQAAGQAPVRDYQHTMDANPLLGFSNPAGLATVGNERFSVANARFDKADGAVIPIEGSPDSWEASAFTKSFRRISDKIVFSGVLAYSQFQGKDMGGEVLLNPSDNAINFLEGDMSSVGKKKRETYVLNGALSYSFSNSFSAGIRLDYTAADQAKFKDPRFLNVLADLDLAPGVMFKLSDSFTIGANLVYRHTLEQLSAGLFGTVDTDYDILVDQGAFLGSKEDFDGDHYHVSLSNVRPLTSDRYGLAVQMASGNSTRIYGQLTGLWRTGYFGSRTSTSVVFCEFSGPEAKLEGTLDIPSGRDLHRIEAAGEFKLLSNFTNSYEYKAVSGMNTTIEYHGQNQTLTRTDIGARLAYTYEKDRRGYLPDWTLRAEANALMSSKHTVIYPDYRDQSVLNLAAAVRASRNIKTRGNCFSVGTGLMFVTGSGTPKADGSYGGSSKAKSFDDWLNRQFEYETASRAGVSLDLGWAILSYKKLVPYLKISDSFVTLLSDPQYLDGRTRNVASVSLGCNF